MAITDKYNRSSFHNIELVDGILEMDFVQGKPFEAFLPTTSYTIKQEDLFRPDLICFKNYDNVSYWWLILKYNNIEDVQNELQVGTKIRLPDIKDIEDFYFKNKLKK